MSTGWYDSEKPGAFLSPNKVIFGRGVTGQIGKEARVLRGRKALIVTDQGVARAGLMEPVEEVLRAEKIRFGVYDRVEPEPPARIVDDAARVAREGRYDLIVGLGGGSSDAAGVLRAFCRRFRVSRLDLEEIAYEIGADVPYLLSCGPAWVEGIGEKVERVSGFPRMFYLLAKPSFSVSTREVYRLLGPSPNLTIEPKEVILSRLARDGWKQFCANHLEKVVFARHQELEQIKSELSRSGARTSLMSGSGSTLVGIFSDFARAERAAGALRKKRPGLWARVVRQYKPRATRG